MGKQFKKYLENYTRGQLSELVGHSEEIWKALEQSEFITPRVLGSSDGMICWANILISDAELTRFGKRISILNRRIFSKIGEMLRLIHNSSTDGLVHAW